MGFSYSTQHYVWRGGIILNDISILLFFSKKKHVQVCVEVTWTAVVGVKNASEDFFLIR